MKAFKLKEQKSFVKILKEPPLEKKKTNWSRWLYILLIGTVFYTIGKRIYNANVIIFADGQIELPKQTISFANDIQLIAPWIQEGQHICQGDTLFSYLVLASDDNARKMNISGAQPIDWIVREKLSLKNKISNNKLKIKLLQDQLDLLQLSINTKEKLLFHGIHREHNAYTNLNKEKALIISEINLLEQTNKILSRTLYKLRKSESSYLNVQSEQNAIYTKDHYFISPKDGIVSDIFYEPNEICYRKEEMMTIHSTNKVSISTYFDPNELAHLEINDIVDINFPDGSVGQGIIEKFFVSTYALPSEFQKKYEPTERSIVASVVPTDEWGQRQWKNFYKMDVVVQKQRYYLKEWTEKWTGSTKQ